MENELYKKAKAEFEAAFAHYKRLVKSVFGFIPAKPAFQYSQKYAQKGKPQTQVKYYLKEAERLEKKAAKLRGRKYLNKQGEVTSGKYELAVFLHQLEIGETHFVKKSEWVSKKSPPDKLNRIHRRTDKVFEPSRRDDGSGWDFTRIL